jgi:hypothetical protein
MKWVWGLSAWGVSALAATALAGPTEGKASRASPDVDVVVAYDEESPVTIESTTGVNPTPRPLPASLAPTPVHRRVVVSNPPSRVIQGPLVRRVVPSRYAKPFNKGYYRYEPHLGDIRNLPRELTLPGGEGERETLYSLPPRDRGYFLLPRW